MNWLVAMAIRIYATESCFNDVTNLLSTYVLITLKKDNLYPHFSSKVK